MLEELAKFGYTLERKVENLKNPTIFWETCWNPLSKYGDWNLVIFANIFPNNPLYELHLIHNIHWYGNNTAYFFVNRYLFLSGENSQKKKILIQCVYVNWILNIFNHVESYISMTILHAMYIEHILKSYVFFNMLKTYAFLLLYWDVAYF